MKPSCTLHMGPIRMAHMGPIYSGMFPAPLPMVFYAFRNIFVLREYVLTSMASTTETKN